MKSGKKQQWLALVRKQLPGRMAAQGIAGALADRVNAKTGQLNPSHPTLANDCGVSEATAKRAIRLLLDADLIEVSRPGGRGRHSSNHYRLKGVTDEPLNQPLGGQQRTPKEPLRGSNGGSVRGSPVTYEPKGMNPHSGAPLLAAPGAQNVFHVAPKVEDPTEEQKAVAKKHTAEIFALLKGKGA